MKRLGILTLVLLLSSFGLILSSCPGEGSDDSDGTVSVSSVRINQQSNLIMATGASPIEILATVLPVNASDRSLEWSNSNPGVIEFIETGLPYTKNIRPLAEGTSTITVRSLSGNYSASTNITVVAPVPVTGITVTPTELGVTLVNPDWVTVVTTPAGAPNTVNWTSSNPNIARGDGNQITGYALGTATLTATSTVAGSTGSASITVTVSGQPQAGDPVTRLTLYGLDPDDGAEKPVANFTVNSSRDGSNVNPFLIGDTGRGFTKDVSVILDPTDAPNQRVRWIEHNSNIAIVDRSLSTHTDAIIRGVSNGTALFLVESEANSDVFAYFVVTVIDPVSPTGITVSALGPPSWPLWNVSALDGNGLSDTDYATLGTGRLQDETDMSTGTITVNVTGSGGVPSNLNLSASVTPANLNSSVRVEQISSNMITGRVEFRVTALGGTQGELLQIRLTSVAAHDVSSAPVYLRILQPFASNSALSISPTEGPASINPFTLTDGEARSLRAVVGNNFPVADIAGFTWTVAGTEESVAEFDASTNNPVELTLTPGSPASYTGAAQLEVKASAVDFFGNERTASITRFVVE